MYLQANPSDAEQIYNAIYSRAQKLKSGAAATAAAATKPPGQHQHLSSPLTTAAAAVSSNSEVTSALPPLPASTQPSHPCVDRCNESEATASGEKRPASTDDNDTTLTDKRRRSVSLRVSVSVCLSVCLSFCLSQANHSPGKPGKVREFHIGQ